MIPISQRKWESISIDFMTDLSLFKCSITNKYYDFILIVVNQFSKMIHYVPVNKNLTASQFAAIFIKTVICNHGMPSTIVFDRDHLFTSQFWQSVAKHFEINHRLSIAFHFQTDELSERGLRSLQSYLHAYVNFLQDDWVDLLPLTEYWFNNTVHTSTNMMPFYVNTGDHLTSPQIFDWPRETHSQAKRLVTHIQKINEKLKHALLHAQDLQQQYTKNNPMKFVSEDQVWLNMKNLKIMRLNKKLDHKQIESFYVHEKIGQQVYCLELPKHFKIHDIFHVFNLDIYSQVPWTASSNNVEEITDNDREIQKILDSKWVCGKLKYLVCWLNKSPEHDNWHITDVIPLICPFIEQYHKRYLNCLKSRTAEHALSSEEQGQILLPNKEQGQTSASWRTGPAPASTLPRRTGGAVAEWKE